jgi:CelD/BcsL family acetyltransferase involved in cellulose biosynthesis
VEIPRLLPRVNHKCPLAGYHPPRNFLIGGAPVQMPKTDIGQTANMVAESIDASAVISTRDILRIEIFDSMQPLEAEWRALETDNLASIHQSYDWCATWVEVYRHPLAIIRGSISEKIAFILPLEILRSNMVRFAQFIGARQSNINTGLFSKRFLECVDGFTASHREQIAGALKGKADVLLLQNVPFEWRGRRSPLVHLPNVENQNHAFQLPFLGSFETTLAQVNAKRRRKKYRQQTRMLDDKGGYDYLIASTPQDKHRLLELFFRLKAERFKSAGLPDVFRSPETRDFLHRLTELNTEGDYTALEVHALQLKGQHQGHIPAVAAVSRKDDHVICQFAAIDETLVPETSPGELLFWLMIERFHHRDVALFDFGIGDQTYKRSWCPVETVQYDVILPVSARGRIAALAQRAVTRGKAAIKSSPAIYGVMQRLRAGGGSRVEPEVAEKD